MTVGQMMEVLSKLDVNATIGCVTWDEDGDAWGHNEFTIDPRNKHNISYGSKNLDYYIN